MKATVKAHDGIGLDVDFGPGRGEVTVPAGQKWTGELTGDEVGIIQDELDAQATHENVHPDEINGYVKVEEQADGPPVGSKTWLRGVANGTVTPDKETLYEGASDVLTGVPDYDDVTKVELRERVQTVMGMTDVEG